MKKLILLIIICFNLYQVKAYNIIKKETLFNKVSFLLEQNDSLYANKLSEIDELIKEEEYVKALENALTLNDLCKNDNDIYCSYKTSFLIATIYGRTNKINKSLEFYKQSLKLIKNSVFEKNNKLLSDYNYAISLLRIGSSYQKLAFSEENLIYLDSSKYYYEKIENLPELNSEIEGVKANMYSNLSGIYEYDSIYDKAENYINKAIKIYKKKNNNLGLARATNNLGNIFLSKKEYAKAKDIYLEALSFIKNNNNSRAIRVKAKLYYNLAWSMRKLKDYKAYDFQEMSYDIEDTIREKEFRGIIDRLSSEFDFDLQKKLFDKQKEVILLKEKDKVRTIGVIGGLVFIVLLIVIGYINLRKKNLHLKLSQIELIQIQNLEKLKSESQTRILNATIDGKESERKEIAETLHDNVSALLSSANLHLQAVRKQFNGEIPTEINKTRDIITEASKKIRDLSHTLVSSVLLKFGLNFAIKDIAEKFSNSDLEIETDIRNIRRYRQKFEIKVNNIIQELVNNVLKHSKASKAIINIREHDSKLIIEIIDNGLGFDKTQISLKEGLGINQIDARIQMMKGHFYIKSSFNNGTSIRVELPIQEKEQVILS